MHVSYLIYGIRWYSYFKVKTQWINLFLHLGCIWTRDGKHTLFYFLLKLKRRSHRCNQMQSPNGFMPCNSSYFEKSWQLQRCWEQQDAINWDRRGNLLDYWGGIPIGTSFYSGPVTDTSAMANALRCFLLVLLSLVLSFCPVLWHLVNLTEYVHIPNEHYSYKECNVISMIWRSYYIFTAETLNRTKSPHKRNIDAIGIHITTRWQDNHGLH